MLCTIPSFPGLLPPGPLRMLASDKYAFITREHAQGTRSLGTMLSYSLETRPSTRACSVSYNYAWEYFLLPTKILPRVIITYGACARGGGRRPGFEASYLSYTAREIVDLPRAAAGVLSRMRTRNYHSRACARD